MSRPDPIEYAERLYAAIHAANFSPISFLAFGNAVKEGVAMRNMPRIAAEPFMRVVGEMLDLEEEAAGTEIAVAQVVADPLPVATTGARVTTTESAADREGGHGSQSRDDTIPPRHTGGREVSQPTADEAKPGKSG